MLNLKNYPVGEITRGTKSGDFVIRIEKNLPMKMHGFAKETLLKSIPHVKLYSIATEHRVLGYRLCLRGRPRLRLGWNYLYLFYGRRLSMVRYVYQDQMVRLARSGNDSFVGFLLRTRKPTDTIDAEEKLDDE